MKIRSFTAAAALLALSAGGVANAASTVRASDARIVGKKLVKPANRADAALSDGSNVAGTGVIVGIVAAAAVVAGVVIVASDDDSTN